MTPATRDEIEELERKAKASTQEQWFIIDSTRTPGEFRVGGDGPVVFDNPSSKLEWSLIVGEGDGYSVVFGGTPRADEECHEEIFAALDHIAAACPRTTLRFIARIRELEGATPPPLTPHAAFVKWVNAYDPNAGLHPAPLRAAWDAATVVSSGHIRYLERRRRSLMRVLKMCPCPECFNCICPAEANCVNSTDGTFCRCDEDFGEEAK